DRCRAGPAYTRALHAAFGHYLPGASALQRALLRRPWAASASMRLVTAPVVRRLVASTWSIYWNGLADGAAPRPAAWAARGLETGSGESDAAGSVSGLMNVLPVGPASTASWVALPRSSCFQVRNHSVYPSSQVPATGLPVTVIGSPGSDRSYHHWACSGDRFTQPWLTLTNPCSPSDHGAEW